MRLLTIIVLAMTVITLVRCIPDPLPVDNIAKPESKIVVASQIVPNVGLVVSVTRSVGALEAGRNTNIDTLLAQIVVDDAVVTLHHNGQTELLQRMDYGLYGGTSNQLTPGVTYELRVSTPSLGNVNATSIVQQRVTFASAGIQTFKSGRDTLLQVNYSLNDPAGKNFYAVSVQKFSRLQELQSLLNPRIFTHLTDDTAFEGKFFQDDFKTLFQNFSKGDSVAVVMSSVSEDYYKFLKIRNDRFRYSEFSSEPFNYPTNVQGGYGFFNLHAPDVRVFVVE